MLGAVRAIAERLRGARGMRRARLERFGAIVQLAWPRALVFVDRVMAKRVVRGAGDGAPAWREPESELGEHVLSAPLEAHLQLTNRCGAGCTGCYTGASPQGAPHEWGLAEWTRAVDHLADVGVFHLALGGGESATLPWLGDLAAHARRRGLVPNLTTSGLDGLDELVEIADRFGQINVSLDGASAATYAAVRGFDGFARADAAVRRLRAVKREVGINVVVTRHNFDELGAMFAYARERRLSEVELLRFKPSGRGARAYAELRCTDAQHLAFLPAVLAAARRHRVRVKVDCSYTPMLVAHEPDRGLLAELAVYGCTGGDFLIGAKPDGRVTACSFAAPPPPLRVAGGAVRVAGATVRVAGATVRVAGATVRVAGATVEDHRPLVTELASYWRAPDAFGAFRTWRSEVREPCASCAYHELCRGGCKVVSAHVTGDPSAPDPECPRVRRRHLPVI
jgi:MoaA/NifB/PqqE/SkfB family radical SAM enzyme